MEDKKLKTHDDLMILPSSSSSSERVPVIE
jgi:hypothetical protein